MLLQTLIHNASRIEARARGLPVEAPFVVPPSIAQPLLDTVQYYAPPSTVEPTTYKSFDEFKPEQETEVVLYKGPVGILRASHRAIDEERSMHPHWPYHPHEVEEKIEPGKVVRLDIGIWATGIEFEQGEGIRIVISGRSFAVSNFGVDRTLNKGRHFVHLGTEYASHVVLPFV